MYHSVSKGYHVAAQNRRLAFEQIALHQGGPVAITNSEMSTLIGRFTEQKYKPETVLCELGDQKADAKDHTGASYSVDEIKILRANVITVGTFTDLRWLLSSFVDTCILLISVISINMLLVYFYYIV